MTTDEAAMTADDPMLAALAEVRMLAAQMRASTAAAVWAMQGLSDSMAALRTENAELCMWVEGLRADNLALWAQLEELKAALTTTPMPEPEPEDDPRWTELDSYLAGVVRAIYADQGHAPVSTQAVAIRTGFVPGYTVRLLGDAAAHGAIYAVPGRGKRRSGKWLPFAPSS